MKSGRPRVFCRHSHKYCPTIPKPADVSPPKKKIASTAMAIGQMAWQKDRFTGGAYAFYRPGQWFTVRPALRTPFEKVFFAGEHIADWQGFMEGAVVTGKAAANAVIRS